MNHGRIDTKLIERLDHGKAMFVMQRLLNLTSDGDLHALLSHNHDPEKAHR